MIDVTTQERLKIVAYPNAHPLLSLPNSQVPEVRRLFDENGVRYELDGATISWNGGPPLALMRLSRDTDAAATQALLDCLG